MFLDITLNLDPAFALIVKWVSRIHTFLEHTYIQMGGRTFSLWNFTIAAMVIAFSIAALMPMGSSYEIPSEADEFYDDGYFDR